MDTDKQDQISMMIVKITKTFPVRVMEWLLAGIMFSWSIALWNMVPSDFTGNPVFAGLHSLAEQNTWAFFAFVIGAGRLAVLAINGAWRSSPHLRAAGAFLACFMWLQISLGMLTAETSTTGIAIYPWLLLADIYNVFRASHDARISDERARVASEQRDTGSAGIPTT